MTFKRGKRLEEQKIDKVSLSPKKVISLALGGDSWGEQVWDPRKRF
jgi:hypothetical protein